MKQCRIKIFKINLNPILKPLLKFLHPILNQKLKFLKDFASVKTGVINEHADVPKMVRFAMKDAIGLLKNVIKFLLVNEISTYPI